MKILSNGTVYGLRALVYMVSKEKEGESGYMSIGEISEKMDISFHFLTKTFQKLTQSGLLQSYRGPSGGIRLSRKAEDITLTDIVLVLEGPEFFSTCLLGLPGCGREKPCPVHNFWEVTKSTLKEEFDTTSLAELGNKVTRDRLRLIG
jgi:Rrf2 family transcriptional regulator, iron-sulfur cluster assembly transcription factor